MSPVGLGNRAAEFYGMISDQTRGLTLKVEVLDVKRFCHDLQLTFQLQARTIPDSRVPTRDFGFQLVRAKPIRFSSVRQ